MDQLQDAIVKLTGALNAQIELTKKIEQRLNRLENQNQPQIIHTIPQGPKDENDLRDISKLPDCVKELQVFDGNPLHYVSWVYSVESILADYEIVKGKPIYRAILQSIRQKIRGTADSALISYNIFNENWSSIKNCLSLHYADKRDQRTLEHQLSTLTQGNKSIDEFYANVNHQLSLIINKVKTEQYNTETMNVLSEMYRNRALDVFVRGLSGDISKMLTIQRPINLPEAYSSCLEIQNLNFRNLPVHNRNYNNAIAVPVNQIFATNKIQQNAPKPLPRLSLQQRNMAYNFHPQQQYQQQQNIQQQSYNQQHQNHNPPPARPFQQKPPTPMSVDESIKTNKVNYMNRPSYQNPSSKRELNSDANVKTHKQQRIFHMEQNKVDEPYEQYIENYSDKEEEDSETEEHNEINFTTEASLAYHT